MQNRKEREEVAQTREKIDFVYRVLCSKIEERKREIFSFMDFRIPFPLSLPPVQMCILTFTREISHYACFGTCPLCVHVNGNAIKKDEIKKPDVLKFKKPYIFLFIALESI
jgi:hypothetical protein